MRHVTSVLRDRQTYVCLGYVLLRVPFGLAYTGIVVFVADFRQSRDHHRRQTFRRELHAGPGRGEVIGALVGVWQSYTFFVTNHTFGAVQFHVPVLTIVLILLGSYLATLVTTYLPSRAAARVSPAEALRYE